MTDEEREIDRLKKELKEALNFISRVEQALQLIKDYDSYSYTQFFTPKAGRQIVKYITTNDDETYSTISENTILLSAKLFDEKRNYLSVASTIIHELTHLHQFERSEFRRFFGIDHDMYAHLYFSHSPKSIAENEIEANNQSKRFLQKFDNSGWAEKQIQFMDSVINYKIKYYNYLLDANDLFNAGQKEDACQKIKLFKDAKVSCDQAKFLDYYYCNKDYECEE